MQGSSRRNMFRSPSLRNSITWTSSTTPSNKKGSNKVHPGIHQQMGADTPLHWAAFKGNVRMVCMMLHYKFDHQAIDASGNTALHLAATASASKTGRHLLVIEVLLSSGVLAKSRNM
jgi:ankyrin repeat protein